VANPFLQKPWRCAIYFQLTEGLKRRFIQELRNYWQHHPRYRGIVDHIQGKYSFSNRPQEGIIVKTTGGSQVVLSADSFKGTIKSYVSLARYQNYPGVAIEWVREDSRAIQANDGRFPSVPGVYYIEITQHDLETGRGQFYVDPLLDVYHEPVTQVDTTHFQLQRAPVARTVRLFEMPAGSMLYEGEQYTLTLDDNGNPDGEIVLDTALGSGRYLTADYRYPGTTTGPHDLFEMHANHQAIPGVVLAFGRRVERGDRMAVVVQDIRRPSALEYGGRRSIGLDVEIIARDVYAQADLADHSVIYLWGIARNRLSTEGIEIMDLSMGGESEEVYDEAGDDYFYNSTFSLTVEVEWSVHVPLNLFLRQVAPLTVEQAKTLASLPDSEVAGEQGNIQGLENLMLESVSDPFWSGRRGSFEIIR